MRRFWTMTSLVLALAAPLPAHADDATRLRDIVQSLGDKTVEAFKLEDRAKRREMLRQAAAPLIDVKAMTQSILDFADAKLAPEKRAEVDEQLVAYVNAAMEAQLDRIHPESAAASDAVIKDGDTAEVTWTLTGLKETVDGLWQFRKTAAGWKLRDIALRGSTLTQFIGEKISRHARGADRLLAYLREQQDELRE